MRAYLATPLGVACTAALVLPLSMTPGSATAASAPGTTTADATAAAGAAIPGSTRSLPLVSLDGARSLGAATRKGLARDDVKPFSLVGVVWDDADAPLNGTVQIRTRATGTQRWSAWQDLETHNQEHGADVGTPERGAPDVHGSTAPLWVGASDGVQIRVLAEEEPRAEGPDGTLGAHTVLPQGLRLELVDPGKEPAPEENAGPGVTELPALTKAQTEADAKETGDAPSDVVRPYLGPRPRIVTRKGWGADETLREKGAGYTGPVKVAFVHHSATGDNYTCEEAPTVLRSIYRYHVKSSGWRDIGYNFAVDKCGNIYEGRSGGVAKAVMGAHTLGFNSDSTGIAVLGSYDTTAPPAAVTTALAKLTAWKLGLYGGNPAGEVTVTSQGGGKYAKGKQVSLNTVSGHRDGFITECPGTRLYQKLGEIRKLAATDQGR